LLEYLSYAFNRSIPIISTEDLKIAMVKLYCRIVLAKLAIEKKSEHLDFAMEDLVSSPTLSLRPQPPFHPLSVWMGHLWLTFWHAAGVRGIK